MNADVLKTRYTEMHGVCKWMKVKQIYHSLYN